MNKSFKRKKRKKHLLFTGLVISKSGKPSHIISTYTKLLQLPNNTYDKKKKFRTRTIGKNHDAIHTSDCFAYLTRRVIHFIIYT